MIYNQILTDCGKRCDELPRNWRQGSPPQKLKSKVCKPQPKLPRQHVGFRSCSSGIKKPFSQQLASVQIQATCAFAHDVPTNGQPKMGRFRGSKTHFGKILEISCFCTCLRSVAALYGFAFSFQNFYIQVQHAGALNLVSCGSLDIHARCAHSSTWSFFLEVRAGKFVCTPNATAPCNRGRRA